MKVEDIKRTRLELGLLANAVCAGARGFFHNCEPLGEWQGATAERPTRPDSGTGFGKAKAQGTSGYKLSEAIPATLNFEGDPEAIKLVVDAHRLRNGHQFNKAFGLELSRVVPLPISAWRSMSTCCRRIR